MNHVPATKPSDQKSPWNKRDIIVCKCLVKWMDWGDEDMETMVRNWSHGRLGRKDITQDHIKALNKYLREKIIEMIGVGELDDFISESLKKEGLE
jgi:hypothetical protein